ncbi:hypothetical protein RQP46_006587 [Phenoliferia psychrophenolica]
MPNPYDGMEEEDDFPTSPIQPSQSFSSVPIPPPSQFWGPMDLAAAAAASNQNSSRESVTMSDYTFQGSHREQLPLRDFRYPVASGLQREVARESLGASPDVWGGHEKKQSGNYANIEGDDEEAQRKWKKRLALWAAGILGLILVIAIAHEDSDWHPDVVLDQRERHFILDGFLGHGDVCQVIRHSYGYFVLFYTSPNDLCHHPSYSNIDSSCDIDSSIHHPYGDCGSADRGDDRVRRGGGEP